MALFNFALQDNTYNQYFDSIFMKVLQEERRERFLSKVRPEWHLPHFMH